MPENTERLRKADELRNAAAVGYTDVVEELLRTHPAVVNMTNGEGKTAAMLAAENGHAWTVFSLARKGADLHRRDHGGSTAWTLAEDRGHELVMNALATYRAYPENAAPSFEPGQHSPSADPGHWSNLVDRPRGGLANPENDPSTRSVGGLLIP
jgi:ankyrin repeat protein